MKKFLKVLMFIFLSLLLLILIPVVWLNTRYGKNFVRSRAELYLRDKLKTEVSISGLGYGLPKFIELQGVLFKDRANDTLLSVGRLRVNINMLALLNKTIDVKSILLESVTGNIRRGRNDSNFNFTYIIDAFAGTDTAKAATSAKDTSKSKSSLKMQLGSCKIIDLNFRFMDTAGGNLLVAELAHLDLDMHKLDIDHMQFGVKNIILGGLRVGYTRDTSYLPAKPKTDDASSPFKIAADKIDLANIAVNYSDKVDKFSLNCALGGLQTGLKEFDLDAANVVAGLLSVQNTAVAINIGRKAHVPPVIDTLLKIGESKGWAVHSAGINLKHVFFRMDDENAAPVSSGMDYGHLNVKNINVDLAKIAYSNDSISGDLRHLALNERCGLVVKELHTEFFYSAHGAVLNNLLLQTQHTTLRDHAEIYYSSLEDLKLNPGNMKLKLAVRNSAVAIPDVLLFAPFLIKQDVIRKYRNDVVHLEALLAGPLNKLVIERLNVAGFDNTVVDIKGNVNGLPEMKKLGYALTVSEVRSTAKMIALLVPPEQLSSVQLPRNFSVKGKIVGTMLDYRPDLSVTTTDGDAVVNGYLLLSPGKGNEKYDMVLTANRFNAGKIFRQDSMMGSISASVTARGTGFDPKHMSAAFKGNIGSASFKNYPYSAIVFDGKVINMRGNLNVTSNDPAARFVLVGAADFTHQYPGVKADLKIDSLDFQQLRLYKDPFRIHGNILADFPDLNPDYPNGVFSWTDPVISINGQRIVPDSITLSSKPSKDTGQNIIAYLDALQAHITGKIPLTKIPEILKSQMERHYGVLFSDSAKMNAVAVAGSSAIDTGAYSLNFVASVADKPILHGFLPHLTSFDSIHIDGLMNERDLTLNASVPSVVYESINLNAGAVQVRATDTGLTYKVTANRFAYGDVNLCYADIHGNIDNNNVSANISIADEEKKQRFALTAQLQQQGDEKVLHLLPGLLLDYKTWQVAQPNSVTFGPNGYYVNNLALTYSGQSIKVNSAQQQPGAELKAELANFSIGNITHVVSRSDTPMADGILNGYATLKGSGETMIMNAAMQVKDLAALGDTMGDVDIVMNNSTTKVIDTRITLKGRGNDAEVAGKYFTEIQNGNQFDLAFKLNSLNLHSFESLSGYKFKNSTGTVKGNLQLQGTVAKPDIKGELTTDKLVTTISDVNGTFSMPGEKISFAGDKVTFHDFKLLDSAGNKAVIDGNVSIADLTRPVFDLKIDAKKWRAMHSTKKDNGTFYGDLVVTTDLTIKGTPDAPDVDGNIYVLKGTDLVVITPESDPQMEGNKGIVEFRNMHDSVVRKPLAIRREDTLPKRKTYASGASVNVNITIDKQAQLGLVLDQSSGDFIKVRGVATLNSSILRDGTIGLTGNYELTEGTYQLNYNFIKRRFAIKSGSSIVFAGDPVHNSNLNITAVYTANIAPYDLVQKEIQDPVQLNYFKQKLPFEVELHMKGELLKPALTFDVVLPDNKVYPLASDQIELIRAKLGQLHTDTSQLNKQVFAVLLLSRFVAEDPFTSGASSGIGATAMQSVSRFIGEQLNQAAGRYVKGVDLSVDLATTEDYTTGDLRQRTDLSLAASKRLLDDRLKLTVGNDFELEGPQVERSQQDYLIPSNLSADYALSADGRYSLRAYRKNYNEGMLQGYVTETGLDFIVSLDYNRFKSIFIKKNPKNSDTKN